MKKFFWIFAALAVCLAPLPATRAEAAVTYLPQIRNVGDVFDKLQEDKNGRKIGTYVYFTVDDWPDTESIENHLQGIAMYKDFYIFSNSDDPYGRLVFVSKLGDKDVDKKTIWKDTALEHPGGIQVIGDYLLMGAEGKEGGKDVGKILLYDLTPLNNSDPQVPGDPKTLLTIDGKSRASTVGVTDILQLNGIKLPYDKRVYIIGVTSGSKLDLYSTNQVGLDDIMGITELTLQATYDFSYDSDYHSMALFCSNNDNSLHFIGFRAPSSGATYRDTYDVYQLTDKNGHFIKDDKGRPKQIRYDQHCITEHYETAVHAGVHFRWGSGIQIESSSEIKLLVTKRNCNDKEMAINIFEPASDSIDNITPPEEPAKSGGGCSTFGFGMLALVAALWTVSRNRRR